MSFVNRSSTQIISLLQSNKFFYASLGIFTLGVLWIALASIYPMAFDEEFHYGLIKVFATSWLPYGIQHTSDMAQFGSATADPSYLFHYLMSFPYRLIDLFNLPDDGKIIFLRLINIGFIVGSIVVFRRVLLEAKIGRASSNLALLFFMFIPTLNMLSAQVNYDSLLMLIVAFTVLLTLRITRAVLSKKGFPAAQTWTVVILLLFGMSIKYAFLPIAAGIGVWLLILVAIAHNKLKKKLNTQLKQLLASTTKLNLKAKIFLIIFGVLGMFFVAHYGVNYVTYGSPLPSCDQVFDREACKAYGPWNRNQNYISGKNPNFVAKSAPEYVVTDWLPGMARRLTFSLAGKTNGFFSKPPLPILHHGFIILTIIGVVCLLFRIVFNRLKISPLVWLTILLSALYCGALIVQLYSAYVETSVPVAINGRYLLILLPLIAGILMQSILHYAKQWLPVAAIAVSTTAVILLMLVSGAGANSYIIRADPHWLWPGFGQESLKILQPALKNITAADEISRASTSP